VGAELTSAWEVGNARRGLEPIRGPRKRKVGDHLVRGELFVTVVMCILVVEMGEVERERGEWRKAISQSHVWCAPPESHLFTCMCLT
jgi:hypothetical protein